METFKFNTQNISFKLTKTKEMDDVESIIVANNKYIISETLNQLLKIEDINSNSLSVIKYNSNNLTVIFHPQLENIFLLADENIIKIYEIIKDKCECKEKVKVTGHSQSIITAVFSNTDNKIFATFSMDKTIKIWNLEEPFCICNILVNNPIDKIQIYKNYIFYYNKAKKSIIKYNYKIFKIENEFQYGTRNYIIINENKLCLIYPKSLSIIENNVKINNYKFKDIYYHSFYDKDLKILYIFYTYSFDILNLVNMKPILTDKINGELKIFYSNILNEVNTCANFILLFGDRVEYYSFYYEEGFKLKINIDSNKKSLSESNIWVNVVPKISNIENLRWAANCEENIKFKNYLNNKEIIQELESGYDMSLDEKKILVEKEINSKKLIRLDYIQIIKLIIKDNTNKNLIIKYLKYLEENNNCLKVKYNDNFESFQHEKENYKIMFDDEELKENKLELKTFSQKYIFMKLLKRIDSLEVIDDRNENINNNINIINKDKEINIFNNEIENKMKNLQLFNQPINISNKELYWQRNCYVLYFALKDILKNKKKLILMKKTINRIFEKKIFDKEYILNDNVLLSSILILIVNPQSEKYLEFNLNLIETKDPSYNYENEINNHNFHKLDKKDKQSYYITYKNNDYILNEPSTKCINNFVLNIKKEIYLEEFEEKTYNGLKDFFNKIIDFNKMKSLLSKIFTSKVLKEAFNYLYPSYFKFPFKNEKEASDFLKKYYHFIPLKTLATAGITEKFSLEIYYILKKRKCSNSDSLSDEMNKLFKKILYRGAVVKTSCHEINHDFYNILFMHTNGMIPLQTPRKQYIVEKEGGRNMEVILFNRKIYKLSLLECLYLLNEKNYEKNLQDFRNGFNELNYEDLIFDDNNPFKEFNKVLKINNFMEIAKNTDITCDENEESYFGKDTYIEDIEDVNDILGFIRDPLKF